MRRIPLKILSLLLLLPGTAWTDIGSNSVDDSAQHAPAGAAASATEVAAPGFTAAMPVADLIIVRKSERRLYLMQRGAVLRSYRVALGLQPEGPKERAGDFRTPEGRYLLTRRNPRSDYFLSIQVSYPNDGDVRRARHQHVDPGGSIMLHGLPNNLRHPPEYYAKSDWTDGCIAMSDSDMVELWMMTQDNTPIDIRP
ncbi:MAG: L,D-transpeptidase family protein [Steroidobacteraceae bacterium]